jgi:diguanylate cyclase (GGDEF)-like protein
MSQVPEHILQRLRTCTSFPSPPAVAMQVLQLAQDPEIDLGRVADAVSADPAIAAKVMRIANSAMYSRRRQSTNLRQALIVLGLNATLTLALSFTLVSTLKKNTTKGFDFNAYWRRTVLASAWGKLLASETGRRDAEEIFLAALLQDLGMLVIDKIWPEVYEGISPFKIEHSRICQHEQNCIGTDHRSIGAALLRIWNMPESLVRAVQHSHDPSAAGVDGDEKAFVRAVAMSGELSDVWLGSHNEVALRRVSQQAHRYLGIQPNRLGELFEAVREQLPVAEELFEMELFDAAQLQDITDSAQEILIVRNLYQINANEEVQQEKYALEKAHSKLKTETIRDVLTSAYNRRHFETRLGAEFAACADSGYSWPLSLIFIDLDKFKNVNDSYGHQAGDAILKAVADLLAETLRDSDIVARYGGDEFVLLLPGVDADKVNIIAQRICAAARTRKATVADDKQVGITLSLGVATCDAQNRFENAQALLAAADSALYESKRSGRDRFTLHKSEAA